MCCRQVVAELAAPDCSRNFSSFNATLLSQIYVDFAKAVGNHTVAMQLSTLPSWLFSDGYPISKCNDDPWQPCEAYGTTGGTLRDQVIPTPSRVLGRISPIFPPFCPSFARFHRLAEEAPTSRKPEPRAKRRWQGGPNTVSPA